MPSGRRWPKRQSLRSKRRRPDVLRKIQQYRDAIAACFQANDTALSMRQILAWIDSAYIDNNFSKSTLTAQVYKSCVNVPYARSSSAPKILFFDRSTHTYQRAGTRESAESDSATADIEAIEDAIRSVPRLASEADLQTCLVQDLPSLEEGLTLWSTHPPSVEYTFDNGRRVDILARDTSGAAVVIELKRDKAYDKVIGQALLYRGLLKQQLGTARVRIFLVATSMTNEIKAACSTVEDVELFEYSVHVRTQRISPSSIEE